MAYVVSGMYGDVRELGAGNAILIILQVAQRCPLSLNPFLSAAAGFSASVVLANTANAPCPITYMLTVFLRTGCA